MAFKHKIDKETFDSLSADVQKEYEEKDGEYFLQVEGMVPKTRVDEFRDSNIELKKKNSKLEKAMDAFGDMTAEELEELKKKAESGTGELDEEQLNKLVEERVAKQVTKMQEDHANEVNGLQENLNKATGQLSTLIIDSNVQREAIKAGVQETAVQDILLRANSVFRVEDGKAVPYKENEVVYGKDGQTPQTINEWLTDMAADAPHLFKESKGGGANQQHQQAGGAGDGSTDKMGIDRMRHAHSQS